MSVDSDPLSELLVAQLLEEDLLLLSSAEEAEKLQLDQVLAASARGRTPKSPSTRRPPSLSSVYLAPESDQQFAQRATAKKKVKAPAVEISDAPHTIRSDGKIRVPEKFVDILTSRLQGYFSFLGWTPVHHDKVMAPNSNVRLKIERCDLLNRHSRKRVHIGSATGVTTNTTCGICLEPFQVTHSPIAASLSANSSAHIRFGLRLSCPKEHSYCVSCLTTYIQGKLDPGGSAMAIVFPIKCPECPITEWFDGIQDNVAERILGEKDMVHWYHQRILDSIPRLYCPNPKCSALVQAHEDADQPQAQCPSCKHVMCVRCRARWHSRLTCQEYQRSSGERLLQDLAQVKNWCHCPNCKILVELVSGCNHMTCRCGTHFCFKCGSPSTTKGKCQRNPSCKLWEEDMLLEETERRRMVAIRRASASAALPIPAHGGVPAQQLVGPQTDKLPFLVRSLLATLRGWITHIFYTAAGLLA